MDTTYAIIHGFQDTEEVERWLGQELEGYRQATLLFAYKETREKELNKMWRTFVVIQLGTQTYSALSNKTGKPFPFAKFSATYYSTMLKNLPMYAFRDLFSILMAADIRKLKA